MFAYHLVIGGLPDDPGLGRAEICQDLFDLFPVVCHQDLLAGLEERLGALPTVRDDAGRRTGRFKEPGGARVARSRRTLPADVHHGTRSRIEGVVVPGIDMPQMPYVPGQGQGLPTTAPQDEPM